MKRHLRLALGILLSLLFLYLSVRNIDWPELWRLFSQGNYWFLIPAVLVMVVINVVRAYRWRLLMYPDHHHLPLMQVFRFVNIGYLFNNILPAKAGEVVRTYLVGRIIEGGIGKALSTLLVERLLDVLTLVLLSAILFPFTDVPDWLVRGGLVFGGVSVAGTVALVVLSRFGERGVDWLWRWVGKIPLVGHPKVEEMVRNVVRGFGVLTRKEILPAVLLSSCLIWFGYAVLNYTMVAVFRMTHLPFGATSLVLCATGFSMVIPSSPGAMGVFEWAGVQALAVYGVEESAAFGYTFGLHMATIICMSFLGLIGLMREGLSWTSVREQATHEAEIAQETDTVS